MNSIFAEKNSFKIILGFALLGALFWRCTPDINDDKLTQIANEQFKKSATLQFVHPDSINIVIDASASMKGFSTTGSFNKLFTKTITSLGSRLGIQYYKFDTTLKIVEDCMDFFEPTLFHGSKANFESIFSISKSDTNKVTILITDLQFNNQKHFLELIRYFQDEIHCGRYIKIFSAIPEFSGKIFPQFVNTKDYLYSGPRPLYAIVFGQRVHAEFVELVLKRIMPWDNSITLSNEAPLSWEIINSNASVYSNSEILGMSDTDDLEIKIRIIGSAISEWNNWIVEEVQIDPYVLKDTVFFKNEQSLKLNNFSVSNDTCEIELFGENINPRPPKLWRLLLKPADVPLWVSNQSCDPNGNQALNTVKFKDFIDAVINPILSPLIVSSYHIYIREN